MSGRPRDYNHDEIIALRKKGLTYQKIGEIVGTNSQYIWLVCKRHSLNPVDNQITKEKRKQARQCVEYILENGGYPKTAIAELDAFINTDTVRRMADEMNVNLQDYYHFKRENRNWIVNTPGFHRDSRGRILLTATCKHCGNKQSVSSSSLSQVGGPICNKCGIRAQFKPSISLL